MELVVGEGGRFSSDFRPEEVTICSSEGLFFLAGAMSSSSQSARSSGTLVRLATRGRFCVLQRGWSEPLLENPCRPAIASLYC